MCNALRCAALLSTSAAPVCHVQLPCKALSCQCYVVMVSVSEMCCEKAQSALQAAVCNSVRAACWDNMCSTFCRLQTESKLLKAYVLCSSADVAVFAFRNLDLYAAAQIRLCRPRVATGDLASNA